jgi:hypothetical protein
MKNSMDAALAIHVHSLCALLLGFIASTIQLSEGVIYIGSAADSLYARPDIYVQQKSVIVPEKPGAD